MKLYGISLRAGIAAVSLAAGASSALYAVVQTLQRMDGPTRAAMATLAALPEHAPEAKVWIAGHANWAVQESTQPLADLPGYSLRTAQLKPRAGVPMSEVASLIAAGEQASPVWRAQELDVRSVGCGTVDVSRLVFSRVERSAR